MCFIDRYVFLLSSGLLMGFIWSTWTISTASAGQWDTGLPVWVFFFTRTEYGIEPDQFSQRYLNRLK